MSSEAAEAMAAMLASHRAAQAIAREKRVKATADLDAFKADHQERRRYGLRARHRIKLARNPRPEPLV
jgi:hypothetical protein